LALVRITPNLDPTFFDEGFTEQTDPFGRRDLAERLTHLFGSLDHGTVSILDGRWGIGKTVFARQWAKHLEVAGVPSIYFDAFAADYVQDPFQAISAALIKAATDGRKTNSPV
jgi:hypothetical protein